MNTKPNLETRIANRSKSIFASFGQVVNDFYLEAGIYFVGGFNAALVSWNIYTDLVAGKQPLAYAVVIAIIAFIAVEGLAVYLVGAAAKTSNGLLWFFSVVFAGFFTYAHYQQMAGRGDISEYITFAIPFFVVIGYWAKTVKADVEGRQALADKEIDTAKIEAKEAEQAKLDFQIEQARLAADHKRKIEQARLAAEHQRQADQRAADLASAEHQRQMDQRAADLSHDEKMARIEAKKVSASVPKSVPEVSQKVSADKSLGALKAEIIAELGQDKPNMSQLATRLDIGRGTLYRHLGTLAGTGEVIKNGNGYEIANS